MVYEPPHSDRQTPRRRFRPSCRNPPGCIDDVLAEAALLGRVIETFVVAQLRVEAAISRSRYRLAHLREQNGRREVDLIAELGGGRIIGIEIKASGRVRRSDARHLEWLRDAMGDRFVTGLVMHTGPDTFDCPTVSLPRRSPRCGRKGALRRR